MAEIKSTSPEKKVLLDGFEVKTSEWQIDIDVHTDTLDFANGQRYRFTRGKEIKVQLTVHPEFLTYLDDGTINLHGILNVPSKLHEWQLVYIRTLSSFKEDWKYTKTVDDILFSTLEAETFRNGYQLGRRSNEPGYVAVSVYKEPLSLNDYESSESEGDSDVDYDDWSYNY